MKALDAQLWFDVESKYEATQTDNHAFRSSLWFDVESKYEATKSVTISLRNGCGLMQNQNMKRVELKLKEPTAPVAWWVPLKK